MHERCSENAYWKIELENCRVHMIFITFLDLSEICHTRFVDWQTLPFNPSYIKIVEVKAVLAVRNYIAAWHNVNNAG